MERFRPLSHPSDVGIQVFGRDRKELLENAAFGMFCLMADLKRVQAKEKLAVKVKGNDLDSLLVNWLNELIFHQDSKKLLFKDFKIKKMTGRQLEAEVWGEPIDQDRHFIYRPIKAATYNQLQIGENQAKIIFDV